MKLSSLLFLMVVVVLVLMAVFLDNAEAARKKKGKKAKPACKYERKGEESPCNVTSNTIETTLKLKKGDPATCQPTKTVSKPCNDKTTTKKKKVKGCKYDRKGSEWTECDPTTNEKTKIIKLKTGANPECPETRIKTKSCGGGNKKKGSRKSRKDA